MTSLEGALIGIGAPYFMVAMLRRCFAIPKQPDILFVAGAATACVALLVEDFSWPFFGSVLPWEYALLIRAFLMIALIEEIAKISLIFGRLIEGKIKRFGTFAIVAASIGAGFAGAENGLYIMRHGPSVVFMRIFTATPFHICNAIVAAKLLWMAHGKAKQGLVLAALVSAVFLHGLYDYAILRIRLVTGNSGLRSP